MHQGSTTVRYAPYFWLHQDIGLFENRQISELRAKLIFMWSRIRGCRDSSDRSTRNLRNLYFEDFLEALVRLSMQARHGAAEHALGCVATGEKGRAGVSGVGTEGEGEQHGRRLVRHSARSSRPWIGKGTQTCRPTPPLDRWFCRRTPRWRKEARPMQGST